MAYADAARTPVIVDEARQGRIPQMKEELRQRLVELLDDDTKVTEQFAILITAWCHDNPIINQCFGSIADYTELLLPNNILAEGGFVDMLNHTEFITDEDFQSPELIGWLYQFYISERKDEVFAKKGKFEADEIPAATQIFTPNWIVKYMVQNTVGRIYLDNNPYETQLQKKWQYLVEPSDKPDEKNTLKYNELTDLKIADLASGSGHILNECFDLLYDLYIAEGYGRGEAVENIFRHNLTGIDLDTRAKQLSQFALLLKACQKDAAFADAHCPPNVLTMPKPWNREKQGPIQDMLHTYFQGEATNEQKEEIMGCFDLMQNADSLGSIMKFDISENTRLLIQQTTDYWCSHEIVPEEVRTQMPAFKLILALTEKYHALVMNPPYMGSGNMNTVLSKYVKDNYKDGKADLMTVFMILANNRTLKNGKYGMINLPSWLFLSTFETLRKQIVNDFHIDSLLHMGRGIFGIDWGSTAFIISKTKSNVSGVYFRLHKRNFQHIYYYHIKELFLKALNDHTFKYDFDSYRDEDVVSQEISLNSSENGLQLYYVANQKNFEKIPGAPIGYWVSPKIQEIFTSNLALSEVCKPVNGLTTSDNARFLRFWFEPSYSRIGFGYTNAALAARSYKKWFYYNKGGSTRKWYGNHDLVINWENDGKEIKGIKGPVLRNPDYYFKQSISWSLTSSIGCAFRYNPDAALFDVNGMSLFPHNENDFPIIIGALNTKIYKKIASLINPTLALQCGDVMRFPFPKKITDEITYLIIKHARENIAISKSDWDAHETSWDFQRNDLLSIDASTYMENIDYKKEKHFEETGEHIDISPAAQKLGSLEWRMEQYKTKWERKFMQLHKNEEELNRQFIDIYGLQDELTPDVPLNEITILQQGEINVKEDGITWNEDVMTKQLISYAVGCMLGRYRLDKPGLHIAHPNPTDEEIAPYEYNGEQWEIDDDGIMPLMPNDCGFSDNASARFADFIRVALGNEEHVAN